jgi:hypothetical protein
MRRFLMSTVAGISLLTVSTPSHAENMVLRVCRGVVISNGLTGAITPLDATKTGDGVCVFRVASEDGKRILSVCKFGETCVVVGKTDADDKGEAHRTGMDAISDVYSVDKVANSPVANSPAHHEPQEDNTEIAAGDEANNNLNRCVTGADVVQRLLIRHYVVRSGEVNPDRDAALLREFGSAVSVPADTVRLDRVDDRTGALACTVQYTLDVPSMIGTAAGDSAWQVVGELKALIRSKGPTSGSIHYTVKPTVNGSLWVNIVPAVKASGGGCVIRSSDGYANVRWSPGWAVFDRLTNGDDVHLIGKATQGWVQVVYQSSKSKRSDHNLTGYVSVGLISCE